MFGFSTSKSKPSSKTKGNRRHNKQGRNDRGRNDQGRNDQGGNDQEWSEWEYHDDYKQEWRNRMGPDGMYSSSTKYGVSNIDFTLGKWETQWRQPQESIETEETEEYEESAETDSPKNVEIPRRLNPIQIPKQRQGDDEVESREYTHEEEPDTEGTSSQPWATYHGQSVSSQNTPSDFQGARPPWNPQSRPQGTQWPTPGGLPLNPPVWKPQPNFQPSSMGASYGSPPGQTGYPANPGSYAPLPTPQGGYANTGHAYSWQQNQEAATGYGSAVNQPNLHSSSASRPATGQSKWGIDGLPAIHSGYPRGASGAGGSGQREEDEDEYDEEDEVDFRDQAGDEGGTVPSLPDRRGSGRAAQLSQKYETTMKSMAGLAFTEESTQEPGREVSTEERSYGNEPSQVSPGSLERTGRPASYDPNGKLSDGPCEFPLNSLADSRHRQQNQPRRAGYNRKPPILDDCKICKA
jgi:hypothetical protein